ncbi:hypothetical protein D3C76_1838210 [compost metagenome]
MSIKRYVLLNGTISVNLDSQFVEWGNDLVKAFTFWQRVLMEEVLPAYSCTEFDARAPIVSDI